MDLHVPHQKVKIQVVLANYKSLKIGALQLIMEISAIFLHKDIIILKM